jgi:anaerobic magnesium-protoporphyrin IX monomethyl ester cyclase
MRWYTQIGRRVWLGEVWEFVFNTRLLTNGPTLREFLGPSLAEREYALARGKAPNPRSLPLVTTPAVACATGE